MLLNISSLMTLTIALVCEGVFMACNQAWPVAEDMVLQPVLGVPTKMLSMPTEPKDLTCWLMLSTSLMTGLHGYQLQQMALASA